MPKVPPSPETEMLCCFSLLHYILLLLFFLQRILKMVGETKQSDRNYSAKENSDTKDLFSATGVPCKYPIQVWV